MRYSALLCAAAVLMLGVSGCSRGTRQFKVKGTLVFHGEPYRAKHNGSLIVMFVPVVEAGDHFNSFAADVNREDGSFVVHGRDGQGIPAGTYRITINQLALDAGPEVNDMNERFSPKNSTLFRNIGDETPVVIDLSNADGG